MCVATGAQAPVATPARFVNEASDTISPKRKIPLTGEGKGMGYCLRRQGGKEGYLSS